MDIIYVHQTKICYKMVVHILFLKVIDLARCEVCKINGNNKDMYIAHLARKKHLKTIKSEILIGIGAATAANTGKARYG